MKWKCCNKRETGSGSWGEVGEVLMFCSKRNKTKWCWGCARCVRGSFKANGALLKCDSVALDAILAQLHVVVCQGHTEQWCSLMRCSQLSRKLNTGRVRSQICSWHRTQSLNNTQRSGLLQRLRMRHKVLTWELKFRDSLSGCMCSQCDSSLTVGFSVNRPFSSVISLNLLQILLSCQSSQQHFFILFSRWSFPADVIRSMTKVPPQCKIWRTQTKFPGSPTTPKEVQQGAEVPRENL